MPLGVSGFVALMNYNVGHIRVRPEIVGGGHGHLPCSTAHRGSIPEHHWVSLKFPLIPK